MVVCGCCVANRLEDKLSREAGVEIGHGSKREAC